MATKRKTVSKRNAVKRTAKKKSSKLSGLKSKNSTRLKKIHAEAHKIQAANPRMKYKTCFSKAAKSL